MLTWLGSIFGYVVQFFYGWIQNYGFAIIMFTLVTRIIMFPLTIKQQKTAAAQARLSPKLNELKARYGNDRNALNEATQELYSKENISPTAGCLPMLIQFPLFVGMYRAISYPLTCVLHIKEETVLKLCEIFNLTKTDKGNYSGYYQVELLEKIRSGVENVITSGSDAASVSDVVSGSNAALASASDVVSSANAVASASDILGTSYDKVRDMANSFTFLGFDLLQTAKFWNLALVLAFIVLVAQIASMIISNKINGVGNQSSQGCSPNLMAFSMGLFSFGIAFTVPAAFVLYWLTSSLFAPVQSWITKRYFGPVVINAQVEAQRNVSLQLREQKVIDEIVRTKGSIELKPEMPAEKSFEDNNASFTQNNKKKKNGKKK